MLCTSNDLSESSLKFRSLGFRCVFKCVKGLLCLFVLKGLLLARSVMLRSLNGGLQGLEVRCSYKNHCFDWLF